MSSNRKIKKVATVETSRCASCGVCTRNCPVGAITIKNGVFAEVDSNKCIGCGLCAKACPASIITIDKKEDSHEKN